MPDHATSTDPAVQAQLNRLFAHGPGTDTLGLDRITQLLGRLGDPQHRLPPVFHVAGTNGKGSTCAFLRAALEAAGHRVHAYTSPHLVRFNERIRVASRLIDDAALAPLLAEVLDASAGIGASFFEVTTAAAFLAFARASADACVIEVGLGGRLDATNVIAAPLVGGIAALGIDHQAFLGDTPEAIAREKAGIAKRGRPLVTMRYPAPVAHAIAEVAVANGADLRVEGAWWAYEVVGSALRVRAGERAVATPLPALPGAHQAANLALAAAMLMAQDRLVVPHAAIADGARRARWPGRMQRLGPGPLTDRGAGAIWVDGAHNAQAAAEVARTLQDGLGALIVGVLANKDARGVLAPLIGRGLDRVVAVPVPGHAHHGPADLTRIAGECGARWTATADTLPEALRLLADAPTDVLIAGSLYLAGEALRLNDELPD